jgi:hypothetical protein
MGDIAWAYKPMACRSCGAELQPDLTYEGKMATSFATCMYRCGHCQVGYSNAREANQRRALFAKPERNIPSQLADGLDSVLASAFNVRARSSKRARFGSSESEDAVTWSVFQFLRRAGELERLAALCGLRADAHGPASLLLWGSPVDGPLSHSLSKKLGSVCDALGERQNSRSELDVVVAWPALLIVVEAKTGSANEVLKGQARTKIDRYTTRHDIFSVSADAVRALGYYELVRNWRIAADLADVAGIPTSIVINLGPDSLRSDVLKIRQVVTGSSRRLEHMRWVDLVAGLELPGWFASYASDRRLSEI